VKSELRLGFLSYANSGRVELADDACASFEGLSGGAGLGSGLRATGGETAPRSAGRAKEDPMQEHLASQIGELSTLEELSQHLRWFLSGGHIVDEDAAGNLHLSFVRVEVDRIGSLVIEVRHAEHSPPHFHVRSHSVDASFAIDDCRKLSGRVLPADFRRIRYWHRAARERLVGVWNDTRPTDCSVGPIRDGEAR